jgi:multidrug resistance protein MdtO
MATLVQSVPESRKPLDWFWEFLREELTLYPGRVSLCARMLVAASLVMIITLTFRVPYGAYGAIYALNITRESPQTTVKTVHTIVVAFVLGAAYVLIGAFFFVEDPLLRFLWIIGTFVMVFFAISAMSNYGASSRFGYLIAISVPLWDLQVPAETRVEGTLWAVWTITFASVIAMLVQFVFAAIAPGDDFAHSIANRLDSVKELLTCYLADRPVDPATEKKVTRFAVLGTSRLRRILRRSPWALNYSEQMGAVLALVGRLVDLAASLTQLNIRISDHDRERIRALSAGIAGIRADLLMHRVPSRIEFNSESEGSGSAPLLREMEKTTSLIPEVFSGSVSMSEFASSPSGGEPSSSTLLVPDAFSNPEHIRFALKGGLAASLCYLIYNSIDWPGISTAITTCLLTALSTIGGSHQKQVLRFAGAIAGGFVIGMGSQVFILPHLDSIAGFTVLFMLVTCVAVWFMTSSPRLSYFGTQIAVAFYLINLQEFAVQTSLAVARDRVVGILLGLLIMWLVFDHLWGVPAAAAMKRTFASILRLVAQLAREPLPGDIRLVIERIYSLRETINANADQVRALADGVLFEFGSSRQQDLALRDHIRQWQPQLRTLFLMRNASVKYRLQLPGFELPEAVRLSQQAYDDRSAGILEDIADRIEGNARQVGRESGTSLENLEQTVEACSAAEPQQMPQARVQSFIALLRGIDRLTTSLDEEIATAWASGQH